MLNFKCNKGEGEISAVGNIEELMADTMTMIHTLYNDLMSHSEEHGEMFKKAMIERIEMAFMKPEEIKAKSDEVKAKKASMNASLEKVADLLDELLSELEDDEE